MAALSVSWPVARSAASASAAPPAAVAVAAKVTSAKAAAAATATATATTVVASRGVSTREAVTLVRHPVKGTVALAAQDLAKGTVIHEIRGRVFPKPTMHTVCLGRDVHVVPTDGAECVSHACFPAANVEIRDVTGGDLPSARMVVSRPVKQGEELAFNYNTTEWEMSCPFTCSCPACQARGEKHQSLVRGFKFLSREDRSLILNACSPYIRARVAAEEDA